MAFNLTTLAAFTGLTAAIALRVSWWWPLAVILGILGFGYLFSLSSYGSAEEGPPMNPELDTRHSPPSGLVPGALP